MAGLRFIVWLWGFRGFVFRTMQPSSLYFHRKISVIPRGSIYTTIMELGPQNHNRDGLSVPNSIMAVYMEPLGL